MDDGLLQLKVPFDLDYAIYLGVALDLLDVAEVQPLQLDVHVVQRVDDEVLQDKKCCDTVLLLLDFGLLG